uniref:Sodium/potassium-transporting ATPase subunit beta n=1 Tax=Varanus komodoensis TaxID=61221 RepID=A0A8D2L6D3_VARKO
MRGCFALSQEGLPALRLSRAAPSLSPHSPTHSLFSDSSSPHQKLNLALRYEDMARYYAPWQDITLLPGQSPTHRLCLAGLILLFYLVLYTFLAGMFAFCLYIMLLTLSPYTPTYRDRVAPPGVMMRPYIRNTFNIAFNISQRVTWEPYVENMEHFLQGDYNDAIQESKNIVCTPGQYFIQEEESSIKQACQFKRSELLNCSGIDDQTFGFSLGQPCILLKMNRIIGYQPGYGKPVTVSCKMQKGDESHLHEIKFYPSEAFDPMYFPYYGKRTHVNYTQPVVAVQFTSVSRNHNMNIQCQLNGQGIINDYNNDRFLGRIIFTLNIGE